MPGRTVILSDTHLGATRHAALSADALRPLWSGESGGSGGSGATQLVINGDVAELLHKRYRDRAAKEIIRLTDLCQEDRVALTMLSGNHDPSRGVVRHLDLADGLVLVTHGDVLHPAISPWARAAERLQAAFHDGLEKLPPDQRDKLENLLEASRHAAHVHWDADDAVLPVYKRFYWSPRRLWALAKYWKDVPRLAAELASRHRPMARFIIIGHSHRHGIWRVAGRTVINTGSFGFPGRPRAVVIEAGRLSVWPILKRRGLHRLGAARWRRST